MLLSIENTVVQAVIIGLVSAASLPIGALTSFIWNASRKTVAALMAFGAGALLAALTIDLVGSALDHGHFFVLAAGSTIGGLLFVGLDNIVSNYGGYKRKVSTTIQHLNLQNFKYFKSTLTKVGRTDIFKDIDDDDIHLISEQVESRFYAKGSVIFDEGEDADEFYIIARGDVKLINPHDDSDRNVLKAGDAFGRAALFSGTPHAFKTIAIKKSWIIVIKKSTIEALLYHSEPYKEGVLRWLKGEEMDAYLKNHHGLDEQRIAEWLGEVEKSFSEECILPEVVPVEQNKEAFLGFAASMKRVPWLEELNEEEASALADFLVYKEIKKGEYLFRQGEPALNLFFIKNGEVQMSSETDKNLLHRQKMGDSVGSRAFLCGLRHTVSVKALKTTGVWVLKRHHLDDLFKAHPNFKLRLIHYLREPMLRRYLEQRQGLSYGQASNWLQNAKKALKNDELPKGMLELGIKAGGAKGAALAIWLGIMLDGIPESLVIGANMIHAGISFSLVAGLFLSNYPEALSSSRGMREDGMSRMRIFLMWTSIMVFTGLGAGLGHIFMEAAEAHWFSFLEGLAAGAMLTMIAQTMLPEAYHRGGSIVGLATLMGFLCTISLKGLQ